VSPISKFNQTASRARTQVQGLLSPVHTASVPGGYTGEGAPGYARDAKSELFLLAVANMVSEKTFYETPEARDERFEQLVRHVAVTDYAWFRGFLYWLRNGANMRSASVVAAVEGADALRVAKVGGGRFLFEGLARADEPGEAFAYWLARYGRPIPKPIKRGIADAAVRLYDEFSYLKWDSERSAVRFADVIDMLRPSPKTVGQNALFRYILDARHGHNAIADKKVHPNQLRMIDFQANVRQAWKQGTTTFGPEILRRAGLTWEDVLSEFGSKMDKKVLWEDLIPTMGYMALLRNLRNFDLAGISDGDATQVIIRLTDPEQVAKSRQFPFRFLSAYRAAPSLRWGHALETALDLSMANVPLLPGRTLVLVDMSGSMGHSLSERSSVSRRDAAALFGTVLARRSPSATDVVQFGTGAELVSFARGDSVLRMIESRFRGMGGTNTRAATQRFYAGHDRVVIITDEQSHDGDPGSVIPSNVPVYTWNLGGYRFGSGPSGGNNRHVFGGLNDAAFKIIPLLERGENAPWPWETADGDAAAH
jgi:hypothetical protein